MYNFENESELNMMYEEYFPKVYNFIFYRLLHREQTEDIVSEVFLKIIANINKFDPDKACFSTWIFSISNNVMIDHFRKQRRYVDMTDGIFKFEELSAIDFDEQCEKIFSDDRKLLYKALAELDEKQRYIISLKYFGGYSNKKIADITGINESIVSTICARTIAKLKAKLKISFNGSTEDF